MVWFGSSRTQIDYTLCRALLRRMDTTIPTRIRLSPATLAALKARADAERRSITVMAGMLLDAALGQERVAMVVPLTGTDAPARPLGSLLKSQTKRGRKRR